MTLPLVLAAVTVAALVIGLRMVAHVINLVAAFLRKFRPLVLFVSGAPMNGQHYTDATFLRGPTKVLHPRGRLSPHWWHWRPGWHRGAARLAPVLAGAAVAAGLAVAEAVTLAVLAILAAAAAGYAGWRTARWLRSWPHRWHYERPVERYLMARIPAAPVSSVAVTRLDGVVESVAVDWKPEAEIGPPEKEIALEAVTTRLAIEAPDDAWNLKGRNRSVRFTRSEPPPSYTEWNDRFAAAIKAAAFNELVFGDGKRDSINAAKYSQSPHLTVPGESGGGKSNLVAFLLLQELMRGSLIFNLDPKWISQLWLQGLPNVINALEIPDLHLALCWIGKELKRRTRAAYYSAGGTGRVRGSPGARIIVLCEELNYGMPDLKDHWAEILAADKKLPREDRNPDLPKKSPAVAALSALACAGRASDMHMFLVAQLLTVDSTGVKDSTIRTNAGIKAMARWGGGWHLAVGKHIPMPPPTTIPGRIQLVTGDSVRETQVPYLHLDDDDAAVAEAAVKWARELAVSRTVARIPSGPEGVPEELWPPCVLHQANLERPAITAGQVPETGTTVAAAAAHLTIAEAVDAGIYGGRELGAARRRVSRAAIEATGQRADGSLTYTREDHEAAALDRRRKEPAS